MVAKFRLEMRFAALPVLGLAVALSSPVRAWLPILEGRLTLSEEGPGVGAPLIVGPSVYCTRKRELRGHPMPTHAVSWSAQFAARAQECKRIF